MRYGHYVGSPLHGHVAGEHNNLTGRDKPNPNPAEQKYPPELVQAAKQLKIHPAELRKQLAIHRKATILVAKFSKG